MLSANSKVYGLTVMGGYESYNVRLLKMSKTAFMTSYVQASDNLEDDLVSHSRLSLNVLTNVYASVTTV